MRIVGIDYGDRYVGFASCDSLLKVAVPSGTAAVRSMREAVSAAEKFVREREAGLIVIGLPLLADGAEGDRASKTRAFGRVLERVTGVPVKYFDERFSTLEAKEYLAEGGVKPADMKKYTDALSAQIILEDYLNAAGAASKEKQNGNG